MSVDWAQDAIRSRITERVASASLKPKHNIKVQLHELPVEPFAASAINHDQSRAKLGGPAKPILERGELAGDLHVKELGEGGGVRRGGGAELWAGKKMKGSRRSKWLKVINRARSRSWFRCRNKATCECEIQLSTNN